MRGDREDPRSESHGESAAVSRLSRLLQGRQDATARRGQPGEIDDAQPALGLDEDEVDAASVVFLVGVIGVGVRWLGGVGRGAFAGGCRGDGRFGRTDRRRIHRCLAFGTRGR